MPLLTSLRLTFRWSNSPQSKHERIGDFVLLGGIAVASAITLFADLNWWLLLLVWLLCLLPAVPFGYAGWVKVFGPVLYYDMICQARRSRFAVLRFIYLLILAFLLFSVTASVTDFALSAQSTHQASNLARSYFEVFTVAQLAAAVLLTPAFVAGAIAEEKDRGTLEFMLATDLRNREIVLSKLGSRLANLGLVVLTGLPILSFLQFLGGVDPNLVLAAFAVTAMTMVGEAGVSILCSVLCKRPREAMALSYMVVVAHFTVAQLLSVAMFASKTFALLPIWFGSDPPVLGDAVNVYNYGNLVTLIVDVSDAGARGTLAVMLPILVRNYAIFHGLVAVVCTALAIARIRRIALAQAGGPSVGFFRRKRPRKRPAIGSQPMMWKELNCESGQRSPWLGRIIIVLLLVATFLPAALIIWYHVDNFYEHINNSDTLAAYMTVWVTVTNPVVGGLLILRTAVRASTCITSERDKQTLDTLLITPLKSSTILMAKFTGSLLGTRLGFIWLALIWAVGIVTGGLHPWALPVVIIAWITYAAFAAALGLWFSTVCRSSLRAAVLTLVTLIGLYGGHWLIWMCCGPLLSFNGMATHTVSDILLFQAGVLTPPFAMGYWPFFFFEINSGYAQANEELYEAAAFCVGGIAVWALATVWLYRASWHRFRRLTNRVARPARGAPDAVN